MQMFKTISVVNLRKYLFSKANVQDNFNSYSCGVYGLCSSLLMVQPGIVQGYFYG